MIAERTFITEVKTDKGLFAGPEIKAESWSEAENKCPAYATVCGELRFVFQDFELN